MVKLFKPPLFRQKKEQQTFKRRQLSQKITINHRRAKPQGGVITQFHLEISVP